MEKITIIFDTNVFGKTDCYNFRNSVLSYAINTLASYDNIDLFIPSIVLEEIKVHIKKHIKEALSKMKTRYIKDYIPRNALEYYYKKNLKEINDFIEENKIIIIDCNEFTNLKEVNEWYFQEKYPFEERKKEEFPDAMIISSIENYFEKQKYEVVNVISFDKGFNKAAKEYLKYNIYDNLGDVLKLYLLYDTGILNTIKKYIIGTKVLENQNNYNINEISENDTIDVTLENADITNIEIIGIENNRYDVYIRYDIDMVGEIIVLDSQMSHYSNYEQEYLSEYYKTTDKLNLKKQTMFISCYFNENNAGIYDYEIIEKNYINMEEYLNCMDDIEY